MERVIVLPLLVVVPLGAAFMVTLLGDRARSVAAAITWATMAALVAGSAALFDLDATYSVGAWPTPIGIDLRVDAFTALTSLLVASVGLATAVYSVGYLGDDPSRGRYYALFLLLVAGMNGVVGAGDLFNLYVFVEIASMAAYALIAWGGRTEQFEASFKYAVLGGLASTLILLGIGALYGVTGTLNMAHLAQRLADPALAGGADPIVTLATAALLAGFAFKAGLVPFHAWLPDAYPAAPTPIAALLSGVLSKVLGVYVLARLVFNILPPAPDLLAALRFIGVTSMVVGGLAALGQRDAKRLLAYSSVEQAGYLVLAVGLGTSLGAVAAVFHMVNHAAFKTLLFLQVGAAQWATGARELGELGGLGRARPGIATPSLVGALSNAGLPPFGGFWSKLLIVIACVHAGETGLATVAVAVSVITLAFQLRLQHGLFFGAAKDRPLRLVPLTMRAPGWVLATVSAALGLLCLGGLRQPLFVGPAAEALSAGRFELPAPKRGLR